MKLDFPAVVFTEHYLDITKDARDAMMEAVLINDADLDSEFKNLPAFLQWWGERTIEAHAAYEEAKLMVDKVAADLDREIRSQHDKVTEAFLRQEILRQDDYYKAKRYAIAVRKTYDIASAWLDALEAKRYLLRAYGEKKRFELSIGQTRHEPMH